MNDNIEKILLGVDIVQNISEVVSLKKSGNNFIGLCPFHNEKGPSFVVSPSKKIFKCFGCGVGGNIITFNMKLKNKEFRDVLENLSTKYNIKLEFFGKRNNDNERSFQILNDASTFFERNLFDKNGQLGLEYLLKERAFDKSFILENNIGYSSNDWNSLYLYLTRNGYEIDKLLSLGLVKKKDEKYYDTFRNRIIFPIKSSIGKVIGFGGRTINGSLPKYLNSSDSNIFHKGKNLYGLVPEEIKKKDYVIIMEGYIDVLKAVSKGFKNSVASLGTSFTLEQASLISKYTTNVVLCFDKDVAGEKATINAILILKKLSFNIKVIDLGSYKDPDELITKDSSKFKEIIKNSKESFDYLYNLYSKSTSHINTIGKKKLIDLMKPFFLSLNKLEFEIYKDKMAILLELDKEVLKSYLSNDNVEKKNLKIEKKLTKLEEESILAIIHSPKAYEKIKFLISKNCTLYFKSIVEGLENKDQQEKKDYIYKIGLEYLLKNIDKYSNDEENFKEIVYSWHEKNKIKNLSSIESKILYASNDDKMHLIEEYYNAKKEGDKF